MKSSLAAFLFLLVLAGCGTTPHAPYAPHAAPARITADTFRNEQDASPAAREVAFYALMLLQTGYEFGGKNPESGFDCSGLVSYTFREAAGISLEGNAASMAREGREVAVTDLRSGDLVFFNTLGRPFSHVGIYLGRGEFVHSPNSRGRVRVEKLTNRYWSRHFEMARTLLN
ncbi:C40 family peptidase [Noviherbaspirillum sp. DKR-6]|uniref:C40 family peptidase n=2 Tax=Noviherbaspirillum pedocola TaxID=2801341 RepID=A0A934W680_9BURK|nr:C40 family peptidase [Noviherbaspirillum pedocola]